MIAKLAIEKAIEGGYVIGYNLNQINGTMRQNEIALDPTFWQALGKALGWEKPIDCCAECGSYLHAWPYEAHRFYDLILNSEETTAFWDELLAANK